MSAEKGDGKDLEKVKDGIHCECNDCKAARVELGGRNGNVIGFCCGHKFSWVEILVIVGLTLTVGVVIAIGIVSLVAWVNFIQFCVVVINLLLGAIKGFCVLE
jgi:hypothetical protein